MDKPPSPELAPFLFFPFLGFPLLPGRKDHFCWGPNSSLAPRHVLGQLPPARRPSGGPRPKPRRPRRREGDVHARRGEERHAHALAAPMRKQRFPWKPSRTQLLGPRARWGRVTKIDYRKKGTLILTSVLEDLGWVLSSNSGRCPFCLSVPGSPK